MLTFVLPVVLGLLVGALLDRAIRRLPMECSLVWPLREHCSQCYQPLPKKVMTPVIGRFLALGRCRRCRARLPWRSVLIPLVTAAGYAFLWKMHVVDNGAWLPQAGSPFIATDHKLVALAVYQSILFSFLLVATFIDLDYMIIPDSVTVPGMILGILLGTFWWIELHPISLWQPTGGPQAAMMFEPSTWKGWFHPKPVPEWLERFRAFFHDHWWWNWPKYLGFATGFVGLVVGGLMVWSVRFICSWAFGKEAMGAGDVTLMMMVGAFLGWQTVIVAFCLAPFFAILLAVPNALLFRQAHIPFGPHLAAGSLASIVFWKPIWFQTRTLFWNIETFIYIAAAMLGMLAAVAWMVEGMKRLLFRMAPGQSIGQAAETTA